MKERGRGINGIFKAIPDHKTTFGLSYNLIAYDVKMVS